MTSIILDQILQVRDSGAVNMCDARAVQSIAFRRDMFELVNYIEEDPARYFHFIIYGEEPKP